MYDASTLQDKGESSRQASPPSIHLRTRRRLVQPNPQHRAHESEHRARNLRHNPRQVNTLRNPKEKAHERNQHRPLSRHALQMLVDVRHDGEWRKGGRVSLYSAYCSGQSGREPVFVEAVLGVGAGVPDGARALDELEELLSADGL